MNSAPMRLRFSSGSVTDFSRARNCSDASTPITLKVQAIGVDASEQFLARLKSVTDPEEKRKRIGAEFIAVFADQARRLAAASSVSGDSSLKYLVQGTLYPDVIESVSVKGPSATIKTHHNVGGYRPICPLR